MGRPSKFTLKLADLICERLSDGESLRTICEDDDMPNRSAVFRWLAAHEGFRSQYAHARESQADTLADEILDLADRLRLGIKTTTKPNGDTETVEGDMVERAKLQIEARKWLAGKLRPKVYGDKVHQEVTGADGAALTVVVKRYSDV